MGNGNLTAKEDISIENLYNFIRASLVALQPTDGFGEADFTCPVCGAQAHIRRDKGEIYNNGDISCQCGYSFHF